MKTSVLFPGIFMIFCYSAFYQAEVYAAKYTSIEQLIRNGSLHATIKSNGGHTGDCITMNLRNNSNEVSYVLVESGRRLDSRDDDEQDMLVVHEMKIALRPHEFLTTTSYSFCCQGDKGGPGEGSGYRIGKMASRDLVGIANFLDKNRYPEEVAQRAVWAVSEHKAFEQNNDDAMNNKLGSFVASTTGLATITSPTARLVRSVPAAITVISNKSSIKYYETTCTYMLKMDAKVSMVIRDSKGNNVRTLMEPTQRPAASYDLEMKLNVEDWLKGKYFLTIYADGVTCLEKSFDL